MVFSFWLSRSLTKALLLTEILNVSPLCYAVCANICLISGGFWKHSINVIHFASLSTAIP